MKLKKEEKTKACPHCGSKKVNYEYYLDVVCVVCGECGYDERNEYDITPEEKTSQKAKANFSPYSVGGPKRAVKSPKR